jgi:hypothetical protein
MIHYVYEIRNEHGEFYIGCRTTKKTPDDDAGYMGSGSWCIYSMAYCQRNKTILSVHEDRYSAEVEESRLIRENIKKSLCKNRKRTSPRAKKPEYV